MSRKGHNTYVTMGASNHTDHDRAENDYYSTDPKALEMLMTHETFAHRVWEPCVGGGHLANVLAAKGHEVIGSDIVDRGYPGTMILDFINPSLEQTLQHGQFIKDFDGDIITNPPYSILTPFLDRALSMLKPKQKLAVFARIQTLESSARREIYNEHPIYKVYVPSKRLKCNFNGVDDGSGSAVCYAWFVWIKGYKGPTTMEWLD